VENFKTLKMKCRSIFTAAATSTTTTTTTIPTPNSTKSTTTTNTITTTSTTSTTTTTTITTRTTTPAQLRHPFFVWSLLQGLCRNSRGSDVKGKEEQHKERVCKCEEGEGGREGGGSSNAACRGFPPTVVLRVSVISRAKGWISGRELLCVVCVCVCVCVSEPTASSLLPPTAEEAWMKRGISERGRRKARLSKNEGDISATV